MARLWPRSAGKPGVTSATSPLPTYSPDSVESVATRAVEALRGWGLRAAGGEGLDPAAFWTRPDTHAVVLLLLVLDRYGPECLAWEPDVLRLTMIRDKLQVSNISWTKILAARVALHSPSPWRQWEVYHWVSRGLSGIQPNIVYLEEPELGHLMLGSDVMHLLDPTRSVGYEVDKFAAAALKNDGQVWAPPPLAFAQRELENRQLECLNCHALHHDDHDVSCITCGATKLQPVPYVFQDLATSCKKLFDARANKTLEASVEDLPTDAAGNLVYHLLVHWDYTKQQRAALAQQLHAVAIHQAP